MNSKIWLPAVLGLALVLQACGSNKDRTSSDGTYGSTTQTSEPYTDRIAPQPAPLDDSGFDTAAAAERALSTNVIYFDFDDTAIRAEYRGVVDAYARFLKDNPSARLRLEGHADERGTREYNLGLGERRALAVESALLAQGVSREQLSILSYGEERPEDLGHSASAWSKNRRVQLVRQ
ncbi:peptidoglycan-associated lipoprotein Pal [Sinimarinibacterium flocculans]|uniref:peptidoglycan-associated lipoprotein Pal n=1 Tax=Sinimarinibacterium flocculans TaxID=985250 RepID=UPI003511F209